MPEAIWYHSSRVRSDRISARGTVAERARDRGQVARCGANSARSSRSRSASVERAIAGLVADRLLEGHDPLVVGERGGQPDVGVGPGRRVPCQAAARLAGGRECRDRPVFPSLRRTGEIDGGSGLAFGGGGASAVRTVQSLPTSGRTSGNRLRSASVGSQVRPSGGPNRAQVFSSRAIAVVVNLASQRVGRRERRRGERLEAEVRVDLALVLLVELQPGPVAVGRVEDDVGRPAVELATVSSRTSRSLVLLQPQ